MGRFLSSRVSKPQHYRHVGLGNSSLLAGVLSSQTFGGIRASTPLDSGNCGPPAPYPAVTAEMSPDMAKGSLWATWPLAENHCYEGN